MSKRCIALLLSIIFFFAACDTREDIMKEVSQDELLLDQFETEDDYTAIISFIKKNPDIATFCARYNVNKYKSFASGYYTVLKVSDGYTMVLFDNTGENINVKKIKFSPMANKENLCDLSIGRMLSDVKQADPDGQYDFLLHSSKKYPQLSYHYFQDGTCFCVKYNEGEIISITSFTL